MTGRGTKRRGRPPKTQTMDRQSTKFNYNTLKKPKYLNDSSFSTPSASRASSPQDSEESTSHSRGRGRPSTSRKVSTRGGRGRKRGGSNHTTKSTYSKKSKSSILLFRFYFRRLLFIFCLFVERQHLKRSL